MDKYIEFVERQSSSIDIDFSNVFIIAKYKTNSHLLIIVHKYCGSLLISYLDIPIDDGPDNIIFVRPPLNIPIISNSGKRGLLLYNDKLEGEHLILFEKDIFKVSPKDYVLDYTDINLEIIDDFK